jgi:nicotinate phosphoribosyltransferase
LTASLSGDEYIQGDKIIDKYKELGINPQNKIVVFSNALDVEKAIAIHRYFIGKILDSYGIGTNFTCDIDGVDPMNIVFKLIWCSITENREGHDCVKLSCDMGKTLGNIVKCNYLKNILNKKYAAGN